MAPGLKVVEDEVSYAQVAIRAHTAVGERRLVVGNGLGDRLI